MEETLELQKLKKTEESECKIVQMWMTEDRVQEMEGMGMVLVPPVDWGDAGKGLSFEPLESDIDAYLVWFLGEVGRDVAAATERDRQFAKDALVFGLPSRWYCFRMIAEPATPLFYYNFHTGESLWTPPHGIRIHVQAYDRLQRYYKLQSTPTDPILLAEAHEDLISTAADFTELQPADAPLSYGKYIAQGVGICVLTGASVGALTGLILLHSTASGALVGAFSGFPFGAGGGVLFAKQQELEAELARPVPQPAPQPHNAGAEHMPARPPSPKTYYVANEGLRTQHTLRHGDDSSRVLWTPDGEAVIVTYTNISHGATYHSAPSCDVPPQDT